jgi:Rhodanese-like domain
VCLDVAPDPERLGVAGDKRCMLITPVGLKLFASHLGSPPQAEHQLDHKARLLGLGAAKVGNSAVAVLLAHWFLMRITELRLFPGQPDEDMTVTTIDIAELHELIASGAQVVEVLPREDYEKLHLPGAISLPLTELNAETARRLDPVRDVVLYCWDGL